MTTTERYTATLAIHVVCHHDPQDAGRLGTLIEAACEETLKRVESFGVAMAGQIGAVATRIERINAPTIKPREDGK